MKLSNHHITFATVVLLTVVVGVQLYLYPKAQSSQAIIFVEDTTQEIEKLQVDFDCLQIDKTVITDNGTTYIALTTGVSTNEQTISDQCNAYPYGLGIPYLFFKKSDNTAWEYVYFDSTSISEGYTYTWEVRIIDGKEHLWIENSVQGSEGRPFRNYKLVYVDGVHSSTATRMVQRNQISGTRIPTMTLTPVYEPCPDEDRYNTTTISGFNLTGGATDELLLDTPAEANCEPVYVSSDLEEPQVDIVDMQTVSFTYASTTVYVHTGNPTSTLTVTKENE